MTGLKKWSSIKNPWSGSEAATGFGPWLHGEAVAAGMVLAADLSARAGLLAREDAARVADLIRRAGLPTRAPAIALGRWHELMSVDKKSAGGRTRFVLLEARHWAVAFVDCSPVIRRVELVERLQGHARFIVVHDTETEPDQVAATVYAFEGVFARFRFRTDYRVFKPFTTILSDESPFELTAAEAVR